MIRLILAIVLALAAALAQGHVGARFSFAVIGDTDYYFGAEWMYADILKDIDREDLAFVVHSGDFKNGISSTATPTATASTIRSSIRTRRNRSSVSPASRALGPRSSTGSR